MIESRGDTEAWVKRVNDARLERTEPPTLRGELTGPGVALFSAGEPYADWVIAMTAHRDSGAIDRTNFAAALERLGGESDSVHVAYVSHCLVGWVRYLLVSPDRKPEAWALRVETDCDQCLDDRMLDAMREDDSREVWDHVFDRRERIRALLDDPIEQWPKRPKLSEVIAAVRGGWEHAREYLAEPDLIGMGC